MRLDVGIVVSERLDAFGIQALLADPFERSELVLAVGRGTAGQHLFPADARMPTTSYDSAPFTQAC